jgi:cyclic pyranopterin phosphate synthase
MGHLHDQAKEYLFTGDEILQRIALRYRFTPLDRMQSSTANYWQTDNGSIFGIIANETEPFCHDCNRLRLDSRGNIYGCLSSNHPILLDKSDAEEVLREKLGKALTQKQALRFTGSDLSMLAIGG